MSSQHIAIIVAMAQNRVIGINNSLPWRIPADLQHFKQLTMGHFMIMGRKTYDSIGKPLPGRTTIVVTRNPLLHIDGCLMADSLTHALAQCTNEAKIFIVGGAEIYQQSLALADSLLVTEVQQNITGDAFFPIIDTQQWQEVHRDKQQQQSPTPLTFDFVEYRRRNVT